MGIHISLYRNVCDNHPDWDFGRHHGDSDFPRLFHKVAQVHKPGDDEMVRPVDIDQLRAAIRSSDIPQPERFLELCDILERSPDTWIYFGY